MALSEKVLKNLYYKISRKDPLKKWISRGLKVGKNFHMLQDVHIDSSHCWLVTIGDNVTLAPGVHILAHDASTKIHLGYTRIGKVDIGNNVFIGAKTIILPNVRIGNNVIIGTGSVVTNDIDDNTVAAGNPAKSICGLEEFLKRKRQEMEDNPCFGREYTIADGITNQMKQEMIGKMGDGIGYVE